MTPEQNKKISLEAFEALFNRKDIEAARAFWSPDYMQHNPLFADGREGLFEFVSSLPSSTRFECQLAVAEGDYVMIHGRFGAHLSGISSRSDTSYAPIANGSIRR